MGDGLGQHAALKKQDSPPPALPPKPVKEKCEVLFAYAAENEDELTLDVGDVVTILNKDLEDPGWWRGELRGKIGVFPDNFVRLMPLETTDCGVASGSSMKKKPAPPPPAVGAPVSVSPTTAQVQNKEAAVVTNSNSEFSSTRKSIANALNNLMGQKPPTPTAVSPMRPPFLGSPTSQQPFAGQSPPSYSAATASSGGDGVQGGGNNGLELTAEPPPAGDGGNKLTHLTAARPRGPANRRPPSAFVSSPPAVDDGFQPSFPPVKQPQQQPEVNVRVTHV